MPSTRRPDCARHLVEALESLPDTEIKPALQAVPDTFPMALYYTDVGASLHQEITTIMHTPVGTVMSRLHRGRRQLRGLLARVAHQRDVNGGQHIDAPDGRVVVRLIFAGVARHPQGASAVDR